MDIFDDHLAGRDGPQDFLPDSPLRDLIDEVARNRESDVSLEQCNAHFAHRRTHVRLAERAAPAKLIEYAAEPIAQTVEHALLPMTSNARSQNAPAGETS